MQVNILYRSSQTIAQCWLQPGESMLAESGAMMGMSTNVQIQTQSGGMMSGLKRLFGGESFFRNTFTAHGGNGEVLLTTPLCGDMVVLECGRSQWILQNSAYVGSSYGVDVQTQGSAKGLFSGAGLFTLATQGQGHCIAGSFGAIEPLPVNGDLIIDTGHIVAWESHLQYRVTKATNGWIDSFLSGEGLVCHFTGQGMLYIQSRSTSEYGSTVGALLPPREN
ncbi:MAG: TIGR00266 family protein [Deltaproteobacteria bacterium]|nr:TIGR00266 family protein [Deltaproteobacteria bacterium]